MQLIDSKSSPEIRYLQHMNEEEPFKNLSFEELLELFSKATKLLLASKINNEAAEVVKDNERLVENIQKAIVKKRAAEFL